MTFTRIKEIVVLLEHAPQGHSACCVGDGTGVGIVKNLREKLTKSGYRLFVKTRFAIIVLSLAIIFTL